MSDKRYIHIQILDREAVKSYEDAAVQVQRVVSEEDSAMPSSKIQGLLRVAAALQGIESPKVL